MFNLLADNLAGENPWDSLSARDDGVAVPGPTSHSGWVITIEEMNDFRDLVLHRKETLKKKTDMDARLKELGCLHLVQDDPSIKEPGLKLE